MIYKLIIFLSASFFMMPSMSHAKSQSVFTPSISIGEFHDDNIYLDADDEKGDWVTIISPSLVYSLISEDNDNIQFRYSPTLVRYKNEDQNDTVRHSGALTISNNLTGHLRLELSDTYLKTEDPVEETEGIFGIRRTRNVYQRNTGRAGFSFAFGPENTFSLGYGHSMLLNDDVRLNDYMVSNPNATLTLWFNKKDGIELNYRYTTAEFTRDDNGIPYDDYTGNNAGLSYMHRFGTRTTLSLGYELTDREFEGLTENYSVHDGSVGLTHNFSNKTSLSISGGYFLQKNEYSDDDNGYTYDMSLKRDFERGSISISGTGGWREGYQEATRTGFTKYYGVGSTFNYQVLERLNNNAGLSFMHDRYAQGRIISDYYRANYGWRLSFLRWFSISLDYSFIRRDYNINVLDYKVNRIMMTLTASKAFR
jgi:hypothetical protein